MKNQLILTSLAILIISPALQAMDAAQQNEQRDKLFEAAYNGNKEKVEQLIKDGADVNAQGFAGETPLMIAAKYSRRDICKTLIDNGADMNITDNKEKTALTWAVRDGSKETWELLIGAMLKLTNEQQKQVDSIVTLLGISKKRQVKQLNLVTYDVVKLIGQEWYNVFRRENKAKARLAIEKLPTTDPNIDPEWIPELLDYLDSI